mmetsp:Transcript_8025/g.29666  ORF Transcript_8025/g.29666 Transcript_8025/m.29666 type:complete len:83 (+) Transcript_8025:1593-1841(+)
MYNSGLRMIYIARMHDYSEGTKYSERAREVHEVSGRSNVADPVRKALWSCTLHARQGIRGTSAKLCHVPLEDVYELCPSYGM